MKKLVFSVLVMLFMAQITFGQNAPKGKYFVVYVSSCDVGYPGVTVYMQDPDGNNFTFVTDENGQIFISKPKAGTYFFEASDGFSTQLDTFIYDGRKNKQVNELALDC